MRRRADQFENALQSSARGEPVEDRLASLVHTVHQVKSLSETPPPPPHGLMPGRQRFLAEAARLRREQVRRQPRPALALRLATALAAIALVFGVVLGVGRAAAASLPGQPLYGAKLAAEGIRMALTNAPESRSALAEALAEERMDEILALLEEERAVTASVSSRAVQQLDQALATAAQLQDPAASLALWRLAEAIRQRERTMAGAAGETPDPPLQELVREMERVREEAQAGEGDPEGLRERLRHSTPTEPTVLPGATGTSLPSRTPGGPSTSTAQALSPSATPVPSHTPQRTGMPDQTPGATATSQPTGGPQASRTPGPSATSQTSEPPHSSRTPEPTGTPAPTGRPNHTPGPGQTPDNGGGGGNKP